MRSFNYDDDVNHVEKRSGLSATLRQSMSSIARDEWIADPRLAGEPAFWLDIHKGLLGASSSLVELAEQFCEGAVDESQSALALKLGRYGRLIVHHAHNHHHIEDHHFFPVFLQVFPKLAHHLELLDGDHKVLAIVLDELSEAAAGVLEHAMAADRKARDQLLFDGEKMQRAAKRLDDLFIRHINDEEEICIPAMFEMR